MADTPNAAANLRPYVPRLATNLADVPVPAHVAVDGSLAFVDISGFTALSERLASHGRVGAEVITATMNSTFTALLETAQSHGGDLLKFGGDALLLLFRGDDHARRSAAAVARMHDRLGEVGTVETEAGVVELGMSAGVATGSVDVFIVGGSHRELVITGAVADDVAAVEADAGRGNTGVGSSLAALLPDSWTSDRDAGPLLRHTRARTEVDAVPDRVDAVAETMVPKALRSAVGTEVATGEHRSAAIGFVKVTGLTSLLADDPDRAASALHEVVVAIDAAVEDAGVTFLATDLTSDGTKVILAAGVPAVLGDDEERLLRAARAIVSADLPLPVKVGVNAGPLFAGDVGAPFRRTYTVMGDTVNLAARLVERAAPRTVLAERDLLGRTRTRFTYRPVPPFEVKGKSLPIHAVEVLDPLVEQLVEEIEAVPMVGRSEESERLASAVLRTLDGRGSVFDIVGDAGMGKTRLVREAGTDQVRTFTVVSDEFTTSVPYVSIRRLLRAALEVPQDASEFETGIAIQRRLSGHDDLRPWIPLIAMAAHADAGSTPEVDALDEAFVGARIAWAVSEAVARLATEPAHIVFEDSQWMDAVSAEIVATLVERTAHRPWVVTFTRRPAESGFVVGDGVGPVRMELGPVADADIERLIIAAAGERGLHADVVTSIVEAADGHPMLALGMVEATESEEALPATVGALIARRIDALPPADRQLLRSVSVLGRRFRRWLTDEVSEDSGEAAWRRLTDFLEPVGATELQFRQALARDVAYEGLPYAARRALHGRVAVALEGDSEGSRDAALLSLHWSLAGNPAKTWEHAVAAGEEAASDHASAEAVRLFERAIRAGSRVGTIPSTEVASVAERLGDVADLAGRLDVALDAFGRAARLDRTDSSRARLLWKRGLAYERVAKYPQALNCLRRALRLADDDALRTSIRVAYAGVRFRQGRYRDCIRWCDDALSPGTSESQPKEHAHAMYLREHARSFIGEQTDESVAVQAVYTFQALGERVMAANVLNNLGVEAYNRGRWDDAARWQASHEEARRSAGDLLGAAIAAYNRGLILLDQGRDDEANDAFSTVRSVAAAAGHAIAENAALACLGSISARAGDVDHALDRLDRAVAGFEAVGATYFVFDALMRRAEARLLGGDPEGALAEVSDSLDRASGHDGLEASVVGLRRIRSEALIELGRTDEAHDGARSALADARTNELPLEELLLLNVLGTDRERRRDLVATLGIVAEAPLRLRN